MLTAIDTATVLTMLAASQPSSKFPTLEGSHGAARELLPPAAISNDWWRNHLYNVSRFIIEEEHISVLDPCLPFYVWQVRLVLLGTVHVIAAGCWDELDAVKHVCDTCRMCAA